MRNIGLDFDDCNIANSNGGVIINGNGVMSGVGLIGNATHDHIISKMGAGLYVELRSVNSTYCETVHASYSNTPIRVRLAKRKKKRNYLQRFWRAYLKNFSK